MLELALAIQEKGYEVSVSGTDLPDALLGELHSRGLACYGNGWFPDRLTKDTYSVVLGRQVQSDNPELQRARELGLLTLSVPEFIYQRTKSKTRVVVAGSRGRRAILAMIMAALKHQKYAFDYALTSEVPHLGTHLHFSYESRIALIEGDEHITSLMEKRSQLEFYRPHIAVLTNLKWNLAPDHDTPEAYMSTYRFFSTSIEREGKLIYYGKDPVISQLVEEIRSDITAIPFDQHEVTEHDGRTFLKTRYGEYPIQVKDTYFLINLNAARMACRQLGVKDVDFYKAVSQMYNPE